MGNFRRILIQTGTGRLFHSGNIKARKNWVENLFVVLRTFLLPLSDQISDYLEHYIEKCNNVH